MKHRLAVLLVLGASAVAAPVSAQDQGGTQPSDLEVEARARFQLAQLYYSQARFEEAAREFEAAYAIHPHPLLLHNIYLARRDLGDLQGAADALSRYLEEADDLSPADRRVLEGRLATTRRQLEESATETPEEDPEEDSESEETVETPEGEGAEVVEPPAEPSPASGGMGIVPGAVVLGVGAAALVGAVIAGAMAEGVRAERDGLCTLEGGACPAWVEQDAYLDRFSAARDAGWGLLIAGAAIAAGGAVLLGIGASEPSPESAAVSAGCDGSGCMAAVNGTF